MYRIFVGTDGRGSFPWLQLGHRPPPETSTVRWRLVAQTEDPDEAAVAMQQAHEECYGRTDRTIRASTEPDPL